MKRIIFSMFMAAVAVNINAQLVVDSLGRVGIGTEEMPHSLLSLGDSGRYDADIVYKGSGKKYGRHYTNRTDDTNATYGSHSFSNNLSGSCYGLTSIAGGGDNPYLPHTIVGVRGIAGKGNAVAGVFGGLYSTPLYTLNFAGVYGSETGSSPYFGSFDGKYAGFFNGKVRVTNGIYATLLSPSASTSPSGNNGTTILSDRGECVTDKLSQVQTLQFLRYDQTEKTDTQRAVQEELDIDILSTEDLDSFSESTGNIEPERYLSAIQYGLDADQLKAVYPELVYEDANGNVSINYVEMVPLLVQSINELKAELAELKGTSARKTRAEATAIEDKVSDIDMVRMDQNKPNPFSESTVITLNIPDKTQEASIFIYDMSGKQVQSLPVTERGETDITVYASDLTAGMYIYTLVVDGKVTVTRRMIVENM